MPARFGWSQCEAGPERAAFRPTSAAIRPLGPGPKRTSTVWPGRSSVKAVAAQRFHVDENVRRALAAGQKAETAQAVEPLYLRPLEPAGRRDGDMGARRRHLRRMHRRQFVHGEDAKRLQAARTLQHLDHDARTLIGDLEAVAPQARHVQEDVGHAVVGNDEAVSLGDIEPLDDAGELDDARGLVTDLATGARGRFLNRRPAPSVQFRPTS